jgi:hypothetical protein
VNRTIQRYLDRQDLEEIVAIHWTDDGDAILYERTELDLYGEAIATGVQIRVRTLGGQRVVEARRVNVEIEIDDGDAGLDGWPPVSTIWYPRGCGWVRLSGRARLRVA